MKKNVLLVIFLALIPLVAKATPATVLTCSVAAGLHHTTYDTTGYNTWPSNHADYEYLINTYATDANQFGSGTIPNINGSGNPFGSDGNYLSIFTGYIYAPTTGDYIFAVDGDDAIEVIIDDQVVSGFYGGHGRRGSGQFPGTINLDQGYHKVVFHQQEFYGEDNYYLYWRRPGDTSLSIVQSSALFHCPPSTTVSLTKTSETISDPVNLTVNPKAIPGAVVRYTLIAKNTGSYTADDPIIRDSLDDLISVNQSANWVTDSINITAPTVMGGMTTDLTDAVDGDSGEFNDAAGFRTVAVNCGSLASGEECKVTFEVVIK